VNRPRRHSSERAGHEGARERRLNNVQAVEILVGETN